MINYLMNILILLTLTFTDRSCVPFWSNRPHLPGGSCAQIPRTTRGFDPNKLMEQYMKLRTNIEQFGSFHPNDLISAIKDLQRHKQNSEALEKSKQQLTGKGFDPNGESMFAGSQTDWGFSYYNPNSVMEQYLGENVATDSFGPGNGQASNTGVNSQNGKGGGFNADKLNDHLMSSFKGNSFNADFSGEGFNTNDVLKQENIKPGVTGFNPDKLNYNLMSILNKPKTPVSGEYHIQQIGLGNSGKNENKTSYNFMEPTNYSFQINSQSGFNPDTLNAQLIGSLGYDATAINKETSGPAPSLSAFMNNLNSTGSNMFTNLGSLTGGSGNGAPFNQGSENQHESIPGNNTVQTGYYAVNSGNNQQETLNNPFNIHSNHGNIGTQTGSNGMFPSNQGRIKQQMPSGTTDNILPGTVQNQAIISTQVGSMSSGTDKSNNIQQTMGKKITQTGNSYISGIHMNQNANTHESVANDSATINQTGVSSQNTVQATGIGSLGIGIAGTTGGQLFQNFGTGTSGYQAVGVSSQQGLPGLNGSPLTQTQPITQTGAENTGKVAATGIGSLGIAGEAGQQNLGNGNALGGQQYIASQTGSSNTTAAQATGIGSLGAGYQHGAVNKNNLIPYQGNGGEVIQQTISGDIKYASASGIGGLGTLDHSHITTDTGTGSAGGNQGVSVSGEHSNVVGIGSLGGDSHFGNFGNLGRKEKSN